MPEYDYYVDIRKTGTGKNTKVTGHLTYSFSYYDDTSDFPIPNEKSLSLEFNPLIILGDLRNEKQPYNYSEERPNIDRSWKHLSNSYKYEYGFEKPLDIDNDTQYLKFVSKLDKIMRNNECTTLKDLEKIQKHHKLNLDCKIYIEKKNIYYGLLKRKKGYATEKTYIPLEYKFGETNDELKSNAYMNKNHQFHYHCYTMADVIFSILHFIVIHKYEFRTCALCQKRYVKIPNRGQGKYCSRKSPLGLSPYFSDTVNKKFIGLNCQESMKKFHEIKRNMKKSKLAYIKDDKLRFPFEREFDIYNDKVKNAPTVNNLIELYSFTKKYKFDT